MGLVRIWESKLGCVTPMARDLSAYLCLLLHFCLVSFYFGVFQVLFPNKMLPGGDPGLQKPPQELGFIRPWGLNALKGIQLGFPNPDQPHVRGWMPSRAPSPGPYKGLGAPILVYKDGQGSSQDPKMDLGWATAHPT